MSTKLATEFIERMKSDVEFAILVGQAKTKEIRKSIIIDYGYDFTENELNTVCDDNSRMIIEANSSNTKLMGCCSSGDAWCRDHYA